MLKQQHLPTLISGKWTVTCFRDSFIEALKTDRSCCKLSMYFYAVTQAGWEQVRDSILEWKGATNGRKVILYVGTDHALTDPTALDQISKEGVKVRLMLRYNGVFHPKVMWLQGEERHIAWVGSNNMTRDGLQNNIEFGLLVESEGFPNELRRWAKAIRKASTEMTPALLRSYQKQRQEFEKSRAKAKLGTFTWRKKVTPKRKGTEPEEAELNALIVEVMPRETGADGRQLQLPMNAASQFFGVNGVGARKQISLRRRQGSVVKSLTVTVFNNRTVRIVIGDLEYRDRPCVIKFLKMADAQYEYDIVSQNIFPGRYKRLLKLCAQRTRAGSRRWGLV